MDGIYDRDILEWSGRQSALSRRVARGERVNSDDLDWPNIIAEIESVGRSQLPAVRSQLTQALPHMLKAEAWPSLSAAPGWRAEAIRFRQDAAEAFAPSMRQQLDVEKLFARARRAKPATIDGQSPLPVRGECRVTLEELLGEGHL